MTRRQNQHLLATLLCFSGLNVFPVQANEIPVDTITLSSKSDSEILSQLRKQKQSLEAQKSTLQQRKAEHLSQNIYWGRYDHGIGNEWLNGDGTWNTLWGFVFPGFTQLFTVFDNSAPAWLRWTEGAQLLSLGALSFGGYQLFGDQLNLPPLALPQVNHNTANGLFYGGLGAYTALALVPSTIVSIHDAISEEDHNKALQQTNDALFLIDQKLDTIDPALAILEHVEVGNYQKALEQLTETDPTKIEPYTIHFDRIQQWKQQIFDADYASAKELSLDTENQVAQIEQLIAHPYADTRPETLAELKSLLPDLKVKLHNEQNLADARQREITEEKERQAIYNAAYQLATEGDFYEALQKLAEYDWQPQHAQYKIVLEKRKTWDYAWYSSIFKFAYNQAGSGNIEKALETLWSLEDSWPIDHSDYKRVKQKIKEWQHIYQKQQNIKRKHGFLNNEQIRLLKSKGYPILVSPTFPNANSWQSMVITRPSYNQYSIFYYNPQTHKSYSIIGGSLCGSLGMDYYRKVKGKTQTTVSNPILGSVGIISVGYADAYLSTNLSKSANNCYTVVTPGNLEDWMVDYEDAPSTIKRLTKAEFVSVIQSLKYLP